MFDDRQAQPHPVGLRREIRLKETRLDILGNPFPCVDDGDAYSLFLPPRGHRDRAAFVYRLNAVPDDIDERAAQFFPVRQNVERSFPQMQREGQAGFILEELHRFMDHFVDVQPGESPSRHVRKAREFRRDSAERLDLVQYCLCRGVENFAKVRGIVAVRPPDMLERQPHRRQGIFDFVRHLLGHFLPRQLALVGHKFIAALLQVARHLFERRNQIVDLSVGPPVGNVDLEIPLGNLPRCFREALDGSGDPVRKKGSNADDQQQNHGISAGEEGIPLHRRVLFLFGLEERRNGNNADHVSAGIEDRPVSHGVLHGAQLLGFCDESRPAKENPRVHFSAQAAVQNADIIQRLFAGRPQHPVRIHVEVRLHVRRQHLHSIAIRRKTENRDTRFRMIGDVIDDILCFFVQTPVDALHPPLLSGVAKVESEQDHGNDGRDKKRQEQSAPKAKTIEGFPANGKKTRTQNHHQRNRACHGRQLHCVDHMPPDSQITQTERHDIVPGSPPSDEICLVTCPAAFIIGPE